MTGARFELRQACVQYGDTAALMPTNLTIESGEAVAFVGPSGAGKTTLLRLLNGGTRPTAGEVLINGQELSHLPGRALRSQRSRIGFVHQDLALVPNLRVAQNVLAGRFGRQGFWSSLRSFLRPPRTQLEAAHRILQRVGIGEKLFVRTDKLSGGQQQRVAIARALYQEPQAILADEPVSSVDPARARDSIDLLTRVCREEGLTLCVSLHSIDLAKDFFPRLIGLRKGCVAFDATPGQITDDEFDTLYDLDQEELTADGS